MMSKPVMVIGALGNVGTEIVKRLRAQEKKVRAADIDVQKLKQRFDDSVKAVHFDFAKPETYEATFEGIEKMFLMRPPQITDMRRYIFPAIDAAKRAGVRHIVFLSLIGIEK